MAEKMAAIKITKPCVVALMEGGSKDVFPGDVLLVGKGKDISDDDALFVVAGGRAEECNPAEKKKAAAK